DRTCDDPPETDQIVRFAENVPDPGPDRAHPAAHNGAMAATRAPRRDAVANRERLLDEAERLFAEHGVDAQPHLLAERAGVGPGPLYRHFPTRDDLVRAVYDRQAARITEVLTRAREIEDGWEALLIMLDGSLRVMVESPSFQAVGIR